MIEKCGHYSNIYLQYFQIIVMLNVLGKMQI